MNYINPDPTGELDDESILKYNLEQIKRLEEEMKHNVTFRPTPDVLGEDVYTRKYENKIDEILHYLRSYTQTHEKASESLKSKYVNKKADLTKFEEEYKVVGEETLRYWERYHAAKAKKAANKAAANQAAGNATLAEIYPNSNDNDPWGEKQGGGRKTRKSSNTRRSRRRARKANSSRRKYRNRRL